MSAASESPGPPNTERDEEVLDVKTRMDMLMLGVSFFIDLPSVQDLIDNIERAHTIGPLMDPTAYMKGMDNLRWQTDVLRAVRDFQRALVPVAEEIAKIRESA